MRSIEWLCCWWPWATPNHRNFCIFHRFSYLCSG